MRMNDSYCTSYKWLCVLYSPCASAAVAFFTSKIDKLEQKPLCVEQLTIEGMWPFGLCWPLSWWFVETVSLSVMCPTALETDIVRGAGEGKRRGEGWSRADLTVVHTLSAITCWKYHLAAVQPLAFSAVSCTTCTSLYCFLLHCVLCKLTAASGAKFAQLPIINSVDLQPMGPFRAGHMTEGESHYI